MGITSPTTEASQPRFSILAIMRGSTDSEDEVPRTISNSSLMYLMNLKMENPHSAAMPPRTPKMNSRQVV